MKVLTSSSLSKFRTCPRLYFYEFELKRLPVSEGTARGFGKLVHRALEAWWTGGLEAAVVAMKAETMDEETATKVAAILACYTPPRNLYDVLAVEEPFEVKIESPSAGRAFYGYRLAGKIDLVLKEKATGEVVIVDHKTTVSEIVGFGTYWSALQIDGQMQNYCLARGATKFIYDVIRKPGIKLCGKDQKEAAAKGITAGEAYMIRVRADMDAAPAEFFQWREHQKLDSDIQDARLDLWQQVEMFRACETDARFPRNCNSCVGRYGTCAFLDVCSGRASIEDNNLFRTKSEQHEELAETF